MLFPIHIAAMKEVESGGGGADLTTDLYDWWENASATGSHASNSIGTVPTGRAASVPAAFSAAFETDGSDMDEIFAGVAADGDYTFACVCSFNNFTTTHYFFQAGSDVDHLSAFGGDVRGKAGTTFGATIQTNYTSDGTAYKSIVMAVDRTAGEAYIYTDGTLGDTITIGGTLATSWFKALHSTGVNIACVATATRAWAQADVDIFHNSGSFTNYASL